MARKWLSDDTINELEIFVVGILSFIGLLWILWTLVLPLLGLA